MLREKPTLKDSDGVYPRHARQKGGCTLQARGKMLEDRQPLCSWNKDLRIGDQNVPVSNEQQMLAHGGRRQGLPRAQSNGHRGGLTFLLLGYSQVKPDSHRDAA